jgi:[acyl-carrier-protein] S-malonyltransferase
MADIGFLFPGQGAQSVGMGRELTEAFPAAKAVYDEADRVLGFSLSRVILAGPEAELNQTDIAQPALLTSEIAAWAALTGRWPLQPGDCLAAGHSLGEYSALVAAGALTFADGVKLVRARGKLMQAAAAAANGGMAAVLGLEAAQVAELCQEADSQQGIQPANFNCPGQVVVSGSKEALERFTALASARGARVMPLKVSGPFHSRFMQPAAEGLAAELRQVVMQAPRFPVIANVSAEPQTTPGQIQQALIQQVSGSVRWEDSVRRMLAMGVKVFVEIGPGKVLRGLMKKIEPAAKVLNAFTPQEIEAAAVELSALQTV